MPVFVSEHSLSCVVAGTGKVLENHGIRLSNEDPKKMAESLFNLLENKKLRIDLGRSSLNYIKNFHEKDRVLSNLFLKVKQTHNKS